MVCPLVREIIHSLKLVDYLLIQAGQTIVLLLHIDTGEQQNDNGECILCYTVKWAGQGGSV